MDVFSHLDLLFVGVAVAGTLVLGASAYFSDTHSITNRTFFYFCVITAVWGIINYASYQIGSDVLTLWSLRAVLFMAVIQAFFLLRLFIVFPDATYTFPHWYRYALIPSALLTSAVVLTPLTFSAIVRSTEISGPAVATPVVGPGIVLFGLFNLAAVFGGIYLLLRKIRKEHGPARTTYVYVLAGTVLMFLLIIGFNFILPAAYSDVTFNPLGALFVVPFVAALSFAILNRSLFSVKVAATSFGVLALTVLTFSEIIYSESTDQVVFRASIFIMALIFGINLIRGVIREVRLRETIEEQAKELEEANRKQVSLINFISHEVKGYLTKSEAGFASILEGDMGAVSETLKSMATAALADVRKGVATVMDILEASNLQKGTVAYKQERFDFAAAVGEVVGSLRSAAAARGLQLIYTKDITGPCIIEGDGEKLGHHVIRNLVDNAVKYTLKGAVTVALSRPDHTLRDRKSTR